MFKKNPNYRPIFYSSPEDDIVHVSFLLVPDFSMIAFSSMIEAMRLANWLSGKILFEWQIISKDGLPVCASNGIEMPALNDISAINKKHNLVVCSGINAHNYSDNMVFGWLRRWAREGCYIGAICTGALILAKAGLLNNYRCTVHWANIESFHEEFPDVDLRAELFESDKDRFTCAGGVASIDMVLHDITMRFGHELASKIADQCMHDRIRDGHDNQRLPINARLGISNPKLVQAIGVMEKHTEEVIDREEIAAMVGLSRRQLERLFRRYLNTSPARYYLKIRLERSKNLLSQTTMPITEIAFASGFSSASHFSKCYRDLFGVTPRLARNEGH